MLGTRIGNYLIVKKLGEGGMGAVYEARHERIGQIVAIKVLSPEFAQKDKYLERFFDEAKAGSVVAHPGLAKVFDHGQLPGGMAYIMMERLTGTELWTRMIERGGKLPVPEAVRICRQVASALAAVHDKGIIHRDIKPDNIMIVPESDAPAGERVKVIDFGLAQLHAGCSPRTTLGTVMGTAEYLAPERCAGERDIDGKVDVYSLGALLYEMLSGGLPFTARDLDGLMKAHILLLPAPLSEVAPEVPEPLRDLVRQMMAKQPADRPDMKDVAARLRTMEGAALPPVLLPADPASSRKRSSGAQLAFAAVLGMIFGLGVVWLLWRLLLMPKG